MSKIKRKINKLMGKIIYNKNRSILILVIMIVALAVVAGTSYALFVATKSSTPETMYKTGDLAVTFTEESGSKISLTNQYPMADAAGRQLEPYTFTITNEGNYNVSYTIQLTDVSTGLKNVIKYQVNGSTPKLLSTGNTLDIGTLIPSETRNFELRLWIDNDATSDYANKTYTGNISVSGQAVLIPYFVDNSNANAPELAEGMIPVVYDGVNETWMVADTEKGWYNYGDQIWATAVTVNNTGYSTAEVETDYRSAPAGTEIPMSAINSMWVWIPRYKYRIPSDIGSSSNVTSPPEIDVVFESGTSTTGDSLTECPIDAIDCYYTHPAFRDGSKVYKTTAYDQGGWDKELTGIWVGKFETGGSVSTPLIKPDIQSLRNQTVYNQFVTSLKFAGGTLNGSTVTFSGNSTYGLTSSTDTHMMKNTEWGAVAYLSQSKYGKMGNPNYSGANKEIYKNNSSSYYTGRSSGGVTTNMTYGTCSYIGKACSASTCTGIQNILSGTGASTTGTVYGIYDMSGGAYDRTMGNWAGTVGSSGFTTSNFPGGSSGSKYYDKYTGTSGSSITLAKSIKGDATYETMKWYSDYSYFPYASSPWFNRGNYYGNTSYAGVFSFNNNSGASSSYSGFRVALIP